MKGREVDTLQAHTDGSVWLAGAPLDLPPKERGVLHLLVDRFPEVVPKAEFADRVWRGRAMSDESLARCVAQLRRVLAPVAGVSLRTVYGTGYRLERTGFTQPADTAPSSATLTHARVLMHQRARPALARARRLLEDQLAQDAGDLPALHALCECLSVWVSCGFALTPQVLDDAFARLETTGDDSPKALALAAHLLDCRWRFATAAPRHARAAALDGAAEGVAQRRAWHLASTGQLPEAVQALGVAVDAQPYSVPLRILQARCAGAAGLLAEGLAMVQALVDTVPDSLAARAFHLGYRAFVDPGPALAQEAERFPLGEDTWAFAASTLALVHARCGAPERANALVAQASGEPASWRINFIGTHVALGQADEAIALALEAAHTPCGQLPLLLQMAEARPLRAHPRFASVVEAIAAHDR